VRIVHPYWDTRVTEFLYATPPELLYAGGRSKTLIRRMLARRFPDLGFDRQRKAVTASLFAWSVATQAPAVWRELGGAQALADAGIVDPVRCAELYATEFSGPPPPDGSPLLDHSRTDPMWTVLTLESWLRTHA
jgi:asparagine synthetase B (glutamine-hydrolysing)